MGWYQPLGVQAIEESFSAVASYDIAVPSGWQVFRGTWELLASAGNNLTARASGGAVTRQADHIIASNLAHAVTSGRIAFAGTARTILTVVYDVGAANMVAHGQSAADDGNANTSQSTQYHSSVPTSVGIAIAAGTITGTVRLERIR